MRNLFVSTLSAIALAVPLGIGGLTLTAPVTAADANANAILHHFQTCSRDVIHRCTSRIRNSVIRPNSTLNRLYSSRWLPRGSNGADNAAYVRLFDHWNYHRNLVDQQSNHDRLQVIYAERALRELFASDDLDSRIVRQYSGRYTNPLRDAGIYVASPYERGRVYEHVANERREAAERERREREAQEREAELIERYRTNCYRHGGSEAWNATGGVLGKGSCRAFQNYDSEGSGVYRVDQFVGYNPDDPYGYVQRLEDEIVPGEFDISRYRFTITCEEQMGSIVSIPAYDVYKCAIPIPGRTGHDGSPAVRYHTYNPNAGNLGYDRDIAVSDALPPEMQVTVIEPIANPAAIEAIDDHRDQTVATRAALIDLQNDYNFVEDELRGLIDANSLAIGSVGERLNSLSADVLANREQIDKNTAGIALAYALAAPGLSYGKNFAVFGSVGHFSGESAVGFTGTFKVGESWLASIGGGIAGSGATGGKVAVGLEW